VLAVNNLFNCLEYLCKNSIKAAIYLRAGLALKAWFVKEWMKELSQGQGF